MPTELETQAAEAKCPGCISCWGADPDPLNLDGIIDCQGTELHYPILSREQECTCGLDVWADKHGYDHEYNCAQGRVPDVTLEKVFDILLQAEDELGIITLDDGNLIVTGLSNKCYGEGQTPLEAALAALLASEPVPELQQPKGEK